METHRGKSEDMGTAKDTDKDRDKDTDKDREKEAGKGASQAVGPFASLALLFELPNCAPRTHLSLALATRRKQPFLPLFFSLVRQDFFFRIKKDLSCDALHIATNIVGALKVSIVYLYISYFE